MAPQSWIYMCGDWPCKLQVKNSYCKKKGFSVFFEEVGVLIDRDQSGRKIKCTEMPQSQWQEVYSEGVKKVEARGNLGSARALQQARSSGPRGFQKRMQKTYLEESYRVHNLATGRYSVADPKRKGHI